MKTVKKLYLPISHIIGGLFAAQHIFYEGSEAPELITVLIFAVSSIIIISTFRLLTIPVKRLVAAVPKTPELPNWNKIIWNLTLATIPEQGLARLLVFEKILIASDSILLAFTASSIFTLLEHYLDQYKNLSFDGCFGALVRRTVLWLTAGTLFTAAYYFGGFWIAVLSNVFWNLTSVVMNKIERSI